MGAPDPKTLAAVVAALVLIGALILYHQSRNQSKSNLKTKKAKPSKQLKVLHEIGGGGKCKGVYTLNKSKDQPKRYPSFVPEILFTKDDNPNVTLYLSNSPFGPIGGCKAGGDTFDITKYSSFEYDKRIWPAIFGVKAPENSPQWG